MSVNQRVIQEGESFDIALILAWREEDIALSCACVGRLRTLFRCFCMVVEKTTQTMRESKHTFLVKNEASSKRSSFVCALVSKEEAFGFFQSRTHLSRLEF